MALSPSTAAFALGWTAGMRSATAPALLSRGLTSGRRPRRQPAHALAHPWAPGLLGAAAAGEMVFDKLPVAPSRTSPPALAGRLLSGALVGAAAAAARRSSVVAGVLAGAAGAGAGSFVMERLRREAGAALGVDDKVVAVVEDALTLAIGAAAVHALME